MSPERKAKIGGHTVEEFWWAGKRVVYIDNRLTDETFEAAVARLSH